MKQKQNHRRRRDRTYGIVVDNGYWTTLLGSRQGGDAPAEIWLGTKREAIAKMRQYRNFKNVTYRIQPLPTFGLMAHQD